jgi:hypothetical protein
LSASDPFRSAAPLAAVGIACLGLLPTLGGPDRPLHWAMTAGMVGFGALLWARRRLTRREGALAGVPAHAARHAGRTVLLISAVSGSLVLIIILAQVRRGGSVGVLSLALPALGLTWLVSLGLKALRHRDPIADAPAPNDRPSRRPPANRDSHPSPKSGQDNAATRQVSA